MENLEIMKNKAVYVYNRCLLPHFLLLMRFWILRKIDFRGRRELIRNPIFSFKNEIALFKGTDAEMNGTLVKDSKQFS